jgi:Flp pilus assembly protein TadB
VPRDIHLLACGACYGPTHGKRQGALPILVFLILGLVWAVFLLWPRIRSSAPRGRFDSVGDFKHRLGAIRKTRNESWGSPRAHRAPTPVPGSLAAPYRAMPSSGAADRSRRRRRDVLLVLGSAVAGTFLLVLAMNSTVVWGLQLLCDVLLIAYLVLLVRMRSTATERQAKVHYLPPAVAQPAPAHAFVLRRSASS